MRSRLIVIGGFLGAGKTTLLWEAAQRLAGRGLRVGLITNDQAPDLVDTAFLSRDGVKVAEVSGLALAKVTSTRGAISLRGGIGGSPSAARMLVNARAQMSPGDLERLVTRRLVHLAEDSIQVRLDALRSLSPGRPSPTHRYTEVVSTSAP